ncbi:MAG: ATP-dependent helicase HrpB [Azospirillum sp.]|nr:ATP-dependent helicase HrpB [Azospirillum sp.]
MSPAAVALPGPLPIEPALPALLAALGEPGVAVLQAPPGAGKTTRVPLALLDQPWLDGGRIVVLEPRRLAARSAARRMAQTLGEAVGATVGYRVRLDSRIGPATRVELVTDGLFLRRLQDDPGLSGIGAVLFDEIHERRLDGDLALALCLEARAALRPDLRLLAMSATLDGGPLAALLGGAPIVTSDGRSFPVETRYLPPPPSQRLEDAVAAAVRRALAEESGDLLVFLPGTGEIRRVAGRLHGLEADHGALVVPLYGDLSQDDQDRALKPPPPGRRKVVLATSIAETSLTIDGVRVVIDGGWMRVARFDPGGGMARLDTVRVSQAAAEQRRGRAGRLGPGLCWRLWPEATQRGLAPFTTPEILAADLAPLALELALWGTTEADRLAWLDPPPAAGLAQARALLQRLGALDRQGRITRHGREIAALGVHPRLGHMMLKGKALGLGGLACALAAVLGERDALKPRPGQRDADLRLRLELLAAPERAGGLALEPGLRQQLLKLAAQWRRQLGLRDAVWDTGGAGLLVALAYPDRIAQRRPGSRGQYRLANGRGAVLDPAEPLAAEDWLAVAALDGDRREARIFLAAALAREALEDAFGGLIETVESVTWDEREQAVQARRQRRLGELALDDDALPRPPAERVAAAVLDGIRRHGLGLLPWTAGLEAWRARIAFLRRIEGAEAGWPELGDAALLDGLEDWLAPHLTGVTRAAHLKRLDLTTILQGVLPWPLPRRLDEAAPSHLTVPSGSRIALDYRAGEVPVLAVKLQELFGATGTPTVAAGRVPVLLHLLSPAGRPVQVTRDLAGFWLNGYPEVCRDLRGRYPKHPWPDDPLAAPPTRHAKRRS